MSTTKPAPATLAGAVPYELDSIIADTVPVPGSAGREVNRVWWAAFAAVCAVLLFPFLLTDVPPVLDYPNHLARLVVLADNGADPFLARYCEIAWGIIPDLGIDLIGTPLMWVLPVHVAGRVVLALVLLAPVFGAVAYSRALFGRATWWSLGVALVAYNGNYLQGFLNFNLGTGLALLLAASWLHGRETNPVRTLAIAVPGAVALFFCHLMGLLFYALLIGSAELSLLPVYVRQPRRLARRAIYGAAIFVLPAVLYGLSRLHAVQDVTEFLPVSKKLEQSLESVLNYAWPLDVSTAALLAGGLVLATLAGRLRMPARSAVAVVMIALLYAVTPAQFKGTNNLDQRFSIYFGFMLFCAIAPIGFRPWSGRLLFAGVAALFLVRMGVLSDVWAAERQDIAQFRSVISHVEAGNRVLTTYVEPKEEPEYWANGPRARRLSNGVRMNEHWPALVMIERRAWWTNLFSNPAQQPIRNRPVYQDLVDHRFNNPPHRDMEIPGKVNLCGFDVVLLMNAGGQPDLAHFASDRLTLIVGNDTAALYRIRPGTACPSTKP